MNNNLNNHLNKVLDSGSSEMSQRANILYDYFTKKILVENIKPNKNDTILDFGCGIGRLSFYLSNKVKQVYGVDINEEYIALAKENNNANNLAFYTDLKQIETASVDKIFAFWVLCLIDSNNLEKILIEFRRILTVDGKLFFFEFVSEKESVLNDNSKVIKRKPEFYAEISKQNGFDCLVNKPVFRMPSYGMSIWKKYKFLPEPFLPILLRLEKKFLLRKPENVLYFTNFYNFKKEVSGCM